MTDAVLSLLDGIAGLPLWALAVVVALAVMAESSLLVGLVVPGDLIVLLAASSGGPLHRSALLVLAVAAGSVAGEAVGYLIGRRWGGRVRAGRLGRALGEPRWDRAGAVLERHGARAVFGARYVAAVHAVLPVVAGTLRMPPRRFLGWSGAGALSWAAVYVTAGAAAGASFRQAADDLTVVTLGVVGALALGAAALALRPRRAAGRPTGAGGRAEAAGPVTAASATSATTSIAPSATTGPAPAATAVRIVRSRYVPGTTWLVAAPGPPPAGTAGTQRVTGRCGGGADPVAYGPAGWDGGNAGPVRHRAGDGGGTGVRAGSPAAPLLPGGRSWLAA
jgi:membrane-associated protein